MSVLVEAISVIVPRAILEAKYPGGCDRYERDCPNATYCADDHVTRVGFMTPTDIREFIGVLGQRGLLFWNGEECVEIAVVDEHQGPTARCTWLESGRHPDGFSAAWLKGTDPNPTVCPPNWSLGQSAKLKFVSNEEASTRLLPLARVGTIDVVLDYKTGREVYWGRTSAKPAL